ncbi:hypothetical protein NQ318_003568 [Aromia moschata]|uniref:Nudix hydrolase domain-containing protein n=1 Tax=Aromia moschata TaxID=1265417 RepID=A0AAV8YXH5_9CUCU|nr:hypothetical protein NQ318_003568 [Aromia moschata]
MAQTNLKIWRESASLIIGSKIDFFSSSEFNYKLLCLQRSSNSKVLANTYVFPGGKISKSDNSPLWIKLFEKVGYPLKSLKTLSKRKCTTDKCGILICRNNKTIHDHKGEKLLGQLILKVAEVKKWQKKVHNDPDQFLNMCTQLDIHPDVWSLHDWSNWMTPSELHHRFDTMFFITSYRKRLVYNTYWAFPDEFIKEHLDHVIRLSIPQFYEISRLRNFAKIDDLSKYGGRKVFLRLVAAKEGALFCFPRCDLLYCKLRGVAVMTCTLENSEKVDRDITILDDIPQSNIQNRLLSRVSITIQCRILEGPAGTQMLGTTFRGGKKQ